MDSADVLDVLQKIRAGGKDLQIDELLMTLVLTNHNVIGQIKKIEDKSNEILYATKVTDSKIIELIKDIQLLEIKVQGREQTIQSLTAVVSGLEIKMDEFTALRNQGVGIYKLVSVLSLTIGVILSILAFTAYFTKPEDHSFNIEQHHGSDNE